MLRLILFGIIAVLFMMVTAGIGQYILDKELEEQRRIDRIWNEVIEEIEKGKRK